MVLMASPLQQQQQPQAIPNTIQVSRTNHLYIETFLTFILLGFSQYVSVSSADWYNTKTIICGE